MSALLLAMMLQVGTVIKRGAELPEAGCTYSSDIEDVDLMGVCSERLKSVKLEAGKLTLRFAYDWTGEEVDMALRGRAQALSSAAFKWIDARHPLESLLVRIEDVNGSEVCTSTHRDDVWSQRCVATVGGAN